MYYLNLFLQFLLFVLMGAVNAAESSLKIIVQIGSYGQEEEKTVSAKTTLKKLLNQFGCSCEEIIINDHFSPGQWQRDETIEALGVQKINIVSKGIETDTDSD